MAKPYLKLDTRRELKDHTYPIYVGIGHGRPVYVKTGVSCAAGDWEEKSQKYTGQKAKTINGILDAKIASVTARILELRESGLFDRLTNKQLRQMLEDPDAEAPAPDFVSLGDLFRRVIAAKPGRTGQIYESTVTRLAQYKIIDAVRFDDIDRLWLDGFVASMSSLKPNTQSIHLRNLRAVCNYALDMGVTSNYPFRRYRLPQYTIRKKSLPASVIRDLATMDVAAWIAPYRDIFMLTFYLIGINFVDLCNLEEISCGRVNYTRAKTHKPYSVKVEPEALAIIERLKGRGHLLRMLDERATYRGYYNKLTAGLAALKKQYNSAHPDAPIDELTTYWARHSWATIAAELDIPKETIAAALGHEIGNPTTAIYIDYNKAKVDDANRRVIDHVLGLG